MLRASLLAIAFIGTAILILSLVAGASTEARRLQLIMMAAAEAFGLLGAIYLVFIRSRRMSFSDLGYIVTEPRFALAGIAAGFGALPLAYAAFFLLQSIFGSDTNPDLQQIFGSAKLSAVQAGTILIYLGFLIPIAEELFFRGIVFRWLRQRWSFWPAAVVSSAIFGAAHVRIETSIIVGLLGILMAWLFERSKSLVPAILLHQTYNSLNLAVAFAFLWSHGATTL